MFSKTTQMLTRSLFNDRNCYVGDHLMMLPIRRIHSSRIRRNQQQPSYYESLGIASNSTQGDIKAAYYKLSKQFHPDKNQGCEVSAKKFREISQAYEVLGNYRLRKLYDKGVMHTASAQYAYAPPASAVDIEPQPEDDAETKFYKSRFKKSRVADVSGRTSIYNFDEWARVHYGSTFDRRQTAKAKYDREIQKRKDFSTALKMELSLFGVLVILMSIVIIFSEYNFDEPKTKKTTPKQKLTASNVNATTTIQTETTTTATSHKE